MNASLGAEDRALGTSVSTRGRAGAPKRPSTSWRTVWRSPSRPAERVDARESGGEGRRVNPRPPPRCPAVLHTGLVWTERRSARHVRRARPGIRGEPESHREGRATSRSRVQRKVWTAPWTTCRLLHARPPSLRAGGLVHLSTALRSSSSFFSFSKEKYSGVWISESPDERRYTRLYHEVTDWRVPPSGAPDEAFSPVPCRPSPRPT